MSVLLNWENGSTPDALYVYRSTSSIPDSPLSLTPFATLPGSALTFLDSTALSSTTYFYRVANVQFADSPDAIYASDEIYVETGSAQPSAASDVTTIDLSTVTAQEELDIAVSDFDEFVITFNDVDYEFFLAYVGFSQDGGSTFSGYTDAYCESVGAYGTLSGSKGAYGAASQPPRFGARGIVGHHGTLRITGLQSGLKTLWWHSGLDNGTTTSNQAVFFHAGVYNETDAITHIRFGEFTTPSPASGTITVERIKHRNVAAMATVDFSDSPASYDLNIANADRFDFVIDGMGSTLAAYLKLSEAGQSDFQTEVYGEIQMGYTGSFRQSARDFTADPQLSKGMDATALASRLVVGQFFDLNTAATNVLLHGVTTNRVFGGADPVPTPTFVRFEPEASGDYDSGIVNSQKVMYDSTSVTSTTISGGETAIAFSVDGYGEAQITWSGPLVLSGTDRLILQVSDDSQSTWETATYLTGGWDETNEMAFYGPSPAPIGVALTYAGANTLFGQAIVHGLQASAYMSCHGEGSRTTTGANAWQFYGILTDNTNAITHVRLTTVGGATFSSGNVSCRRVGYFTTSP